MKTQVKLVTHKTWYSVLLEYFLKDKAFKKFVSAIVIINNFSSEEIISQNKCQIRFLEKNVDKNLVITAITCSILESLFTSDDYEINISIYKSTSLEPTIKHLMRETRLCRRAARNLVRRGHNIREKIPLMEIFTLKAMRGCSRYNTTTTRFRE